jgi:NAD(P)-dependent dehydrogenase (short-subunit alcohol dehydrogenase family)
MEINGKIVVVTGAASGIGRGLARRFAEEGARAVVVADFDGAGAAVVADELNTGGATSAVAQRVDVSVEDQLVEVIERTESDLGPIDLFCSNAGIIAIGGQELPDDEWRRIIDVNLMAHIYAARHLVPRMLERDGGYLLNTCSAAGLLTQIGSAPYSVTKHAAVAFAEWLAVTYGDRGLKVSALCPQAVESKMTVGARAATGDDTGGVAGVDGMLTPAQVASAVIEGLADERFLILPHPEVAEYFRRKASDYDRWLAGMRRLQARFGIQM